MRSKFRTWNSFRLIDNSFGCSEAVYEGGKSLGKLIHDSRVIWIAVKYNKTPSQVVLGKLISRSRRFNVYISN